MTKKILLFLFLTISISYSQQNGTLRGVVVDSLKGESLAFANVLLEGTSFGASADLNGNFTIVGIPSGKDYVVRISFVGYNSKFINISIKPGTLLQIKAELVPSSIQLQTIELIGQKTVKPNETNIGLQKMTIRELELLPKGVETDIFRSLQFIPGVQSTGDVSARYYVRGSASNQNLVLLNGATVYNPFHALGLFSIIDPEMISAVEFYKGGFPSEFGGRLSSVLNLVTRDGNVNRFGGNVQVSFLTGKAAFEGPLPGGSFVLTGRKSFFKDILKNFLNYKDAPFEFYDLSGKVNFSNNSEESLTKVQINGFHSLDQLLNDDMEKSDFKWINNVYSVSWFQAWENVPIYSEAMLSLSNFNGEVDPKLSSSKRRKNIINDVTFKTDFTNIFESSDELKVGYQLKSISTDLEFENLQGIPSLLSDGGLSLSLYGKYKLMRWNFLGLDAGTRVNLINASPGSSAFFEPRLNLTLNILPGLMLKGAYGVYTQELITLTNENEVISLFEPWIITPAYIDVPLAIHYIAGIELIPFNRFSFTAETYYKDLKRTAEINELKADETDPDFIQGSGESYGFEFMAKYNSSFLILTGSYALSWAYRTVNDWVSYPKYDTRHIVNFYANFNLGAGWNSSFSWFYNSGLPFTQTIGYYEKLYFDELFYSSDLYGNFQPYTLLADKNLGRLPTYHRLDASLSKRFEFYFTNVEMSLNVMNVYNRKNIFYYERDTGKKVNMLPILITGTIKVEI